MNIRGLTMVNYVYLSKRDICKVCNKKRIVWRCNLTKKVSFESCFKCLEEFKQDFNKEKFL